MKCLYPLAKRFIAGHDFDSAKPAIERLIEQGYEVSVDYIGENSKTYSQSRKAYKQYLEVVRAPHSYLFSLAFDSRFGQKSPKVRAYYKA